MKLNSCINLVAVALIFVSGCKNSTKLDTEAAEIWRKSKNSSFLNAQTTPIPTEELSSFAGLKYFEYDPKWVVSAKVMRVYGALPTEMAATQNQFEQYIKVGYLAFEFEQKSYKLDAYQSVGSIEATKWFVPFADLSAGVTTYETGRYLDLDVPPNAQNINVNFNYAYNPYCAYNSNFVCPIPPAINFLNVMVQAGEKKYH